MQFGIFRNSKEQQQKRERRNVALNKAKLKTIAPKFSFGLDALGIVNGKNEKEVLRSFVETWFSDPSKFLDSSLFNPEQKVVQQQELLSETAFSFPSFLDVTDTARFFESKAPFYGYNDTAFIILPHWNAHFDKYKLGTAIIRNFFLPVSTYRYFPVFATESVYRDKIRYDIVGPNIGLTIKRFQQDVLNIQHFGNFLRNQMGYRHVGIWAYSIGSPRGFVASMFGNGIFDFLILNSLAESFGESLLNGISTVEIAEEIRKCLTDTEATNFLSPLSPGKYRKYFNRLPVYTRLVQGKYDLVFGEENNRRMVELLQNTRPDIDIEFGDFGHTTCGEFEKVLPVVYRNSQFIRKVKSL